MQDDDDDDFDKLMQNAMFYGTGVAVMQMNEARQLALRVVPIEEYAQLGEHLKWVAQNTVKVHP